MSKNNIFDTLAILDCQFTNFKIMILTLSRVNLSNYFILF